MLCMTTTAVTADGRNRLRRAVPVRPCGRPGSRDDLAEGCDHVGPAGLAARAPADPACRIEHQDGRGAQDVQPPHQSEPGLRIHLDVGDSVDHPGDVGQCPPGRPARRAERRGELDKRRPGSERAAQVGRGYPLPARLAQPPGAAPPGQADREGDRKGCGEAGQRGCHDELSTGRAAGIPGHRDRECQQSGAGRAAQAGTVTSSRLPAVTWKPRTADMATGLDAGYQ